ncbi:MAG TPA: response regulator [Terriglobia bacterium]|nr:response regulator [Terriglobia bacterium]
MTLTRPTEAHESHSGRLTVLMLGGNSADWDSCLAAIRKIGIKFDAVREKSSKSLLERLVPGECYMLLVAADSAGRLQAGVLEILDQNTFDLPVIVVTSGSDEAAVPECLKTGVWDCVSRRALWRLPTLAKRVIETHALRHKLKDAEEVWTGVTHDVSNLLSAVLGHSEFVLTRVKDDEELRRAIEGMMKAAENAALWMRQGASPAQFRSERPQLMDLNEVVTGLEVILRLLAGGRIQVRLQIWKEPLRVIADGAQLARIVFNLALNALDAMPAGGQLTIETEAELAPAGDEARIQGGYWGKITVADSGQGMDREQQLHIFDRLYSTRGPDRGLGLPTVHALIERFGGHLELRSTTGKGSTFYVYLPCARQSQETPVITFQPQLQLNSAKRILLVDDDAPLRMVLARTFASAGYTVAQAASAQEAIQIQAVEPEPIDLLLTDVRMSSMNGRDLAEVLRARDPAMKIIYISGCSDPRAASEKNRSDFLMKPFKPTILLEKVQASLAADNASVSGA